MGGGTDGRTDVHMYGRTDSPYSTGLRLLRFPPEPLPKKEKARSNTLEFTSIDAWTFA